MRGRIFNIQRFSINDGPGIRTTVFLKGCPLQCRWCHNPESQSSTFQLMYSKDKCIGCRRCESLCPHGTHWFSAEGEHVIDYKKCCGCGACGYGCLTGALENCGRDIACGELVDIVMRDRAYFEHSGGGVTLSGGEPLAQPQFTAEVLRQLKSNGVSTALDTCGFVPWEILSSVSDCVDLYLYDIKFINSERHLEYTSVPNETILENYRRLILDGRAVRVRVPLIAGLNDTTEEIAGLTELLQQYPPESVSFLPYHSLGRGKSERLVGVPSEESFSSPSENRLKEIKSIVSDCRIKLENN